MMDPEYGGPHRPQQGFSTAEREPQPAFGGGLLTARQRALHFPSSASSDWPTNQTWVTEFERLGAQAAERDASEYRRRMLVAPAWWADFEFVNALALELLPTVVAALGFTLVCGIWHPGEIRWWPPAEPGYVVALADPERRLAFIERRLLFIDRASGCWIFGAHDRRGTDLVSLAALRWGVTETKAAWRLARVCGLRRPHR